MKNRISLSNQLTLISFIVFIILVVSITIFLPNAMSPYLEEVVYNFLDQPLKYINSNNISEKHFSENIAYIQVDNSGNIIVSSNIDDIVTNADYEDILNNIDNKNGTFKINNKQYYYVRNINIDNIKITITNDKFVNKIKSRLFVSLLPVIIITFLLILISLLIWCNFVVRKIYLLIKRVNNINNDNYDNIPRIKVDDELKVLESTIDDTRLMLLEQDNYKNEMYQNISHDFKTPIAVIKSYIEASNDGVISKEEANNVITEQINKLDNKVKSLLQLNKIEYLKENYNGDKDATVDIVNIINACVDKFKLENKNIKWTLTIKKKNLIYRGTYDMWESIIDNLLTNFMRYAKNAISIEASNKRIVLFNDGEAIDESIMNDIFSPYKKGMKGQFGLGLSIVKKTCELLNYSIHVNNVRGGVKFIIEDRQTKK